MANCLITGASGFIGSRLAELLCQRGERIRCLVRATSDTQRLKELGAELFVADFLEANSLTAAVSGVKTVYHIAGVMHTPRPAEQDRVNRNGVSQVLEACAGCHPPPRFILVSSLAAAGPVPRGQVRHESDPPTPVSDYGRSKLAGELVAQAWASHVPVTIVRPGIVFGPRDRNLRPLFRTIARLGIHLVPALRPPRLSLIHVEDLAELLARCAERGTCLDPHADMAHTSSGCYFAAAPEHPTYGELGTLIGTAVGRRHVVRLHLPGLMPWLVAAANEMVGRWRGRSSILRVDKIREAKAPSWECSCEAARRDLDFSPPETLAQRLQETAVWYREQGEL